MKRFILLLVMMGGVLSGTTTARAGVPLPKVPATLTNTLDRAAYITQHFWDAADFKTLSADPELEQDFVNYVSIMQMLPLYDLVGESSVDSLMMKASAYPELQQKIEELSEKYLYDLASPVADEERYLYFLKHRSDSRSQYQRSTILNNRVGDEVADFSFVNDKGKECNFRAIEGEKILLFYTPGCEECRRTMAEISADSLETKVIAIALDCDWEKFKANELDVPTGWEKGFDAKGLINGHWFAIRRIPDMFLIDEDNKVKIKHSYKQNQ